jgi:inhibitor of cysteine peptidase
MTISTTYALRVPVEHTFPITLDANPTTGYQWELSNPVDSRFIVLLSNQYIAPSLTGRLGQGGHQVLTFQSLQKGVTSISLKYCRPWDTSDCPTFAFYTVTIV